MVNSSAYARISNASPKEFRANSVVFFSAVGGDTDSTEWALCFRPKAAAVYSAVTGEDGDEETDIKAMALLIHAAKNCASFVSAEKEERDAAAAAAAGIQIRKEPWPLPTATLTGLPETLKKAVDGVYMVVVLLRSLHQSMKSHSNREEAEASFTSAHGRNVILDIIKYENQLPLPLLLTIIPHVEQAVKDAKQPLLDQKFVSGESDPLLHSITGFSLGFSLVDFPQIAGDFCHFYSPFFSKESIAPKEFKKQTHLLALLHCSVSLGKSTLLNRAGGLARGPGPRARDLARSSVKLRAAEGGAADVEFSEVALKMSALVYDYKTEVVLRNLIAWEVLNDEDEKPVAGFFRVISELIGDAGDVAAMKGFGLMRGRWTRGGEVVEMVRRIEDAFDFHAFGSLAFGREIGEMRRFYEEKRKKGKGMRRPAVIWFAAGVAALTPVVITAIFKARRCV